MIRPVPSVALGRRWHVLAQGLHRLALVAPSPCGFVQAEIWCERTSTSRAKLTTADRAALATGPPELGLLPGYGSGGPHVSTSNLPARTSSTDAIAVLAA